MFWPGSLLEKKTTNVEKQVTLPFVQEACYSLKGTQGVQYCCTDQTEEEYNKIIKNKSYLRKRQVIKLLLQVIEICTGDRTFTHYGRSTVLCQVKLHNFLLVIFHQCLKKYRGKRELWESILQYWVWILRICI